MKKKYIGGIILAVLITAFAIWWIVSAPKSDVYTDTKSHYIFRNVTLVAKDGPALSSFYQNVFGFKIMKDNGEWRIGNSDSKSILLKAPRYGDHGPTFRIISSDTKAEQGPLQVYDLGYAHICFEADDVRGTVRKIVDAGGSIISTFPKIEKELCVYTKDPAGNIVEVHAPIPSTIIPQGYVRLANSIIRTKLQLPPSKTAQIRFLHVNIVSKDWSKLSSFYQAVFGCTPAGSQRDYKGEWIANVVGVQDVHVVGGHVAVPGYSVGGPTLEIFTYSKQAKQGPLNLEDLGAVCIGYETKDLPSTLKAVNNAGGKVISCEKNTSAMINDPDGNFIQIKQR